MNTHEKTLMNPLLLALALKIAKQANNEIQLALGLGAYIPVYCWAGANQARQDGG